MSDMNSSTGSEMRRHPLFSWFPHLEREERRELFVRLEAGSRWDPDFIVMMVLSSGLASLGLTQGSTAVVIGAMLVAPLMGPLLGAGLGLVQGNLKLFRNSLRVALLGVALGFAVAIVIGVATPGFEPSLEVEARGDPDLMDLAIAFFSGMVAAYASARPGVATSLAGVAIAAALVPPLAVVGLALTHGRPVMAGGAAILLGTNLVAIVLGAAAVFRFAGVHIARGDSTAPPWARRMTMTLILLAVLLAAPLFLLMLEQKKAGQSRPLTYPLSPKVRLAVREYIETQPGVEVVLAGRLSTEPEAGVVLILSCEGVLPPRFDEGITAAVHAVRGESVPVTVHAVRSARDRPEPDAAAAISSRSAVPARRTVRR